LLRRGGKQDANRKNHYRNRENKIFHEEAPDDWEPGVGRNQLHWG